MSRAQTPRCSTQRFASPDHRPGPASGCAGASVAVGDTKAEAELPCDHLEIQKDFVLDSEGWEAWLEVVDSPPRDLQGLRAFLTEPIECLYETPADSGMISQRESPTP